MKRTDFEVILGTSQGCCTFRKTLEGIRDEKELLSVLGRYISFNSVFGSGVASLAGQIGSRQDLFRDAEEALGLIADRSVEVAAAIFFAAVGEFGDRTRSTHRTLAQATLKAAASFFGYTLAELSHVVCLNDSTKTAMRKILDGYGVRKASNERRIFHSVGFHIGSEILADQEFNLLDRFLRIRHANLVHYLRNSRAESVGKKNAAYDWIELHTTVEADHFDAAMSGANLALHYYCGMESFAEAKRSILDGVREFATLQENFMKGLLDKSSAME